MSSASWPVHGIEVDVDMATRWWGDYPVKHFNRMTRAGDMHKEFVENAFTKPAKLARSLSAQRFETCKEVQFDYPIQRTASVSSLAPSHALSSADRSVQRYIPTYTAYTPKADTSYYHKSYQPNKAKHVLDKAKQPWRPAQYHYMPRASDYRPELKSTISRIFFEQKFTPLPSAYAYESDRYLSSWIGSRLKMLGYNLPFIYTTFDQGPTLYGKFNRHVRSGNVLYSHVPRAVPKTYYRTISPRYAYWGYGKNYGDLY